MWRLVLHRTGIRFGVRDFEEGIQARRRLFSAVREVLPGLGESARSARLDFECARTPSLRGVVTRSLLVKIGELARRSGLTAHTIRYYERIGLLPYADRDRSSQRDYDASILTWIAFLRRLKTTGMPIREMLRYAALRESGVVTQAKRRDLLERHRARVQAQVCELQACLLVLDTKIAGYADSEQRIHAHDVPPHSDVRPPGRGKPARTRAPRSG